MTLDVIYGRASQSGNVITLDARELLGGRVGE